jgi:HNH endonuclease
MTWPAPSPEEQVQFLRNIQRLLAEGLFVASYKFALLHALADLSVLKGDDTGAPLGLETKDIAAKFIELYWRQSRPFRPGVASDGLVLQQNTGKQAAVVAKIVGAQQECGASLFRLKIEAADRWSSLLSEVDEVVRIMPLWKLQTVGEERLSFLYDNLDRGTQITLKPGVAFCLRAFYELIRDLIEGAWIRFVQQINVSKLGGVTDIGAFLFGEERGNLDAYRPILMALQKGTCLYCGGNLPKETDVDHFIPWSRYPADLGQNFVLAHKKCNNAKSDYLAAEQHLAAWAVRNKECRQEFDSRLHEAGLPADFAGSVQIARWVYQQTEAARGQVWVKEKLLQHLTSLWPQCISA